MELLDEAPEYDTDTDRNYHPLPPPPLPGKGARFPVPRKFLLAKSSFRIRITTTEIRNPNSTDKDSGIE